jgi:methionyl-tRNA synthetase
LTDVSLSRAKITWGVTVPWDESHVFYVWFDALLNYYTALSFAREGEDLTEKFWPASLHLIGKDILKFHAVIWPALLMAAELPVPERLYIHGYLLQGEHKMSKSLGNVIDPFAVIDAYGVDALRHYLFSAVSFGQDGSISTEDFETRYTSELANEYGNLASRTLAMIRRYRDGVVPEAAVDPALGAEAWEGLADRVAERLDRADVSGALGEAWALVRRLNAYVAERAPWQLSKEPGAAAELDAVLYTLAEGLRVVSVLVHPYMPESTARLLEALGADGIELASARIGAAPGGGRVGELAPLFPRVEADAPA